MKVQIELSKARIELSEPCELLKGQKKAFKTSIRAFKSSSKFSSISTAQAVVIGSVKASAGRPSL
jgi:hypothetical protein